MGATAVLCPVLEKNNLAKGIYDLWISCPGMAGKARPGQFVQVKCGSFTLRRPISICEIDARRGYLRLVYEVRGEGTKWLADVNAGQTLDVLGPLGNGFDFSGISGSAVFVGGGIGVPPMLGAAGAFGGQACAILGFRSADAVILAKDFEKRGAEVRLATDDGSAGYHGLVTDLLKTRLDESPCAAVYACGPKPMLRGVAQLAGERGIPCFVSMEERMACGVGACLGCACKVITDGSEHYVHVCKDGPVFAAQTIVW